MSEVRVNLCEEAETQHVQDGSSPEASSSDLQSLQPATSSDVSPSLSTEARGLLSLPWEMVTHIASHLPAHCVIAVLPKVCQALRNVGKDNAAWQLRARRLIGSRAGFPVGPKEDFDWPCACLEMEQLITCWTGQGHLVARGTQEEDEEEREHDGEAGGEGREDGREGEIEGVGVVAQEVAYGVDEGMEVAVEGEDGEMQPVVGGDHLARLREALEERLNDDAAALMEDADALADPRNLGNGRQVEMEQHPPSRSPSPPPALECITLPSDHIAQVNSVLLVGGEGKVCATGSRDWNVKLWDLQASSSGTLLHTLGGQGDFSTHRGWVWCLASRGPLLASGGFDSTVRLWDLEAGGAERGLIRPGAAVLCLSCQTDVLLAGTFDKRVSMYDTRAAEPLVKSLRLHGNAVMCLAADDKYIISGSKDCTVAVYDRRAGKGLKRLRLSSFLLSMDYSGSEVWAGDNSGMLHSFSMQTGTIKPLSQFDVGHTALVTGIHRSPGSLYTCSSDRTVKVG
ncbi:F-box/WD repeat-containing protein 9 F-box and WD-40 domain-containing protein 9 [Collichthys lucidus]|uniref:F-box/WD repeat-containing protein 9 F-box and WD-40 domain-containing protein 9 n=1 Tax=Collichthys lucidus TaxID=240159 RepID=A0A4U5VV14_COLLU|nr:F-box/WD repeat-containing protein 9 F-box and WD-40 domain-containing protein 9 [Collichthys lucidus]